jgi:stage V sporulation protein S
MDRFFSKLDLREIKIDPERTRFSPNDEYEEPNSAPSHGNELVAESSQELAIEEAEADLTSPNWVDVTTADHHVSGNGVDITVLERRVSTSHAAGEVLKVSSKSRPSAVAGAIAGVVREFGRAEVQAIGAGATNQAVKAVAIARDYLRETGIEAICLPEFIDITIDNEERTAIRLVIEPR